jgi:transcriptional regulator with XRE-family HTH domain
MMEHMELHEIIRERRAELNMSQSELAAKVGVDKRQIRRYESGETQPTLPVAKAIASALGISIDELAGEDTHRINLSGNWWACWQTWKDGTEVINSHEVSIQQQGDKLAVTATTRGTQSLEEGGYVWEGEMRLWDNEILMGWYVATEGAVRSKGTMYFVIHQHGVNMTGRWVGLSYDGPIITGWGAIAQSESEVLALMSQLKEKGTVTA